MHRPCSRALAAPLGLVLALLPIAVSSGPLARDRDPLVLTGADMPTLIGAPPGRIVAFRHDGGWLQIPVQVDERAVLDFGVVYDSTAIGYAVLTYNDTSTFAGADPDPGFDADDELVLMSGDAGAAPAGAPEPPGTLPGSGVELTLHDPILGGTAYAYLFRSDGSLSPGVGIPPVTYVFDLLSGSYKATYNTRRGPNPENSSVTTAAYAVHFADRWIRDETRVTAGAATGVDILDRHKSMFGPGQCQRTEDTFSAGEGAFLVNRAGPVRALRGYVGANSGFTTLRIHRFYAAREDLLTVLRVHPIPGVMDVFDYAPAASGMVYRNDLDPAGVTVDGAPDAVTAGAIGWEMVSGAQGTLAMTHLLDTDIAGFTYTSYYLDSTSPPVAQCTGDAVAYGTSGFWRDSTIPNTDPAVFPIYNRFEVTRVIAYDAPGKDAVFAADRAAEARQPVSATAAPYAPNVAVEAEHGEAFRLTAGPQPARGRVRLDVVLPAAGHLDLRLFDLGGRQVVTLASGPAGAGARSFTWDAVGKPAGVYFARALFDGTQARPARVLLVR